MSQRTQRRRPNLAQVTLNLRSDGYTRLSLSAVCLTWPTLPSNFFCYECLRSSLLHCAHGAPTNDQIVTADIRPTTFYAGGGWAGLMARYVNASAYYFALLQNGGTVSLRRWMNGQVTVLDEAPFAVAQAPPIECGWTRWAAICGYTSTANS